jgi:Spherulation-specific family 4
MKRTFYPPLPVVFTAAISIACGSSSTPEQAPPSTSEDGGSGDASPSNTSKDGGSFDANLALDSGSEGGGGGHPDAAAHDGGGNPTVDGGGAGARVAIPMYLDPTQSPSLWTEVFSAAPEVGLLIVSTDSMGAGTSVDSTYTAAIASAHAAGERALGYTYTNSGARAMSVVKADVDAWYSLYPALDGIFVDEVSDDTSTASSYYVPLYTYIKGKGANVTVAINPGTMVDEAFMSASDILLTYEDTYANFIDPNQNPPNPDWVATYPSSRFWNIVLSTDAADEVNAIDLAKGRNAGWIYVTAEGPNTAYQNIETGAYWTTELSEVTAP